MKYVLGIDFGGGASKATLLSESGEIKAVSTTEYKTYYPQNGFVEQKGEDWYQALRENVKNILENSGISANDIAAISIDAATHTAVLCDENFNILRPSIYWTDTRSTAQSKFLSENFGEEIMKKTFHKPSTIWTLPQMLWLYENEGETFKKIRKIMFSKDYVRHCLTGDFVTDYIEAQGSMFFDFNKKAWDESLCAMAHITPDMLPTVKAPSEIVGTVTAEAAKKCGLCEGTAVLCGTTDTALEVLAAGATEKGDITIKLATAGRICTITDKPYPDRDFVNYSHVTEGLWYPGTATKSCAASLRWYRDTFGGDYKELDKGAEKIEPGCEGLMFHPYLNGELTPYADPNLCGSFIGVRAHHTKAHFTRAVLEGVAFSLLDCKKYLDSKNINHKEKAFIIGGGAKSPLWRQIVADVLGIGLIEKKSSDSSLGSAIMAGVSCGFFTSFADAQEKCNEIISETVPNMENHEKYLKLFEKYKAVHDALAPIYSEEI